jgi:hypothetical protein
LCAGLAVSWLALRLTAPRGAWRAHELRAAACFVAALAAYFFLPRSLLRPAYWWGINVRFAVMALLFGILCVPGPIAGRRRLILVPVALLGIAFSVDTLVHWRRVDAFLDGLDALARLPEAGSRVLVIAWPPWREPSMQQNFAQSSNALRQAYYGGYDPDNFDEGFPLRFRERFPAPPWNRPAFRWEQHAPYYDYVLGFHAPSGIFSGHEREVQRVGAVGSWQLWKLPGPRVDEPPGPAYPRDWAFNPAWRPSAR